jgi:DNA-binding NarL/FixJ family response regulator
VTAARILLVDDNEAWLSIVSGIIRRSPRWQVVGIARDGIEAIQKSHELQPDVVVLDLEHPQIYGFEVTRQIRAVGRDCKILFLSEVASPEAAAVALMIGASGYVLKSEAVSELVPALEAVLEDRTFVSKALSSPSTEPDLT